MKGNAYFSYQEAKFCVINLRFPIFPFVLLIKFAKWRNGDILQQRDYIDIDNEGSNKSDIFCAAPSSLVLSFKTLSREIVVAGNL